MKNNLRELLFVILDFCFICYKLAYTIKPLFIIFHKINRYIKVCDESNYLTFIPPDEKYNGVLKKCSKMQDKIKYFKKVKNNDSDCYGYNYLETKIDPNNGLPLKKTLTMYNIVRLIQSVLNDKKRNYSQKLLEESLHKVLKRE